MGIAHVCNTEEAALVRPRRPRGLVLVNRVLPVNCGFAEPAVHWAGRVLLGGLVCSGGHCKALQVGETDKRLEL